MATRVGEQRTREFDGVSGKATTRAKNRKSRLGCAECKLKRLKCDETHPECKQCTKRGRTCPGYSKQYRWSTVHEKIQPPEEAKNFWPQAEHNALLGTLPQSQCHESHCESHRDEPKASLPVEGTMHEAEPTPPLFALPTPGIDGEVFAATTVSPAGDTQRTDHQNVLDLHTVAGAGDLAPWPDVSDFDWFDEPDIIHDENASIEDIFSDLCGRSPFAKDAQNARQQDQLIETALVITAPRPPNLVYTPVDLSTMLMEYWFSDVCPMWSAFDSPSNPHRQLASSAWQQSDAVYYALQSMSAACLVDSLPHVKKYVGVLSSQAVEAIQCGVQAHKQLGSSSKFPRELLLAIICMGTSVCWSDTRQLGLWFLSKAHEVLAQYEDGAVQLDEYGRQELEYFREALVYWEMLYRVVGSDPRGHLKKRKKVYMQRLLHVMSSDDDHDSPRSNAQQKYLPAAPFSGPSKGLAIGIHPWTGISTDIQHTFGLAILLCREHRSAAKTPEKRTAAALSDALCDIRMAQDLARELAQTDVYSGDHSASPLTWSKGTGDSTTPIRHLVDTAEAYRLAAMLVLCQTFPDLETKDLALDLATSPGPTTQDQDEGQHTHASLTLAMKLVETLKRVPAESGTRCIQPILYICAGSGMRFTTVDGESHIPAQEDDVGGGSFTQIRRTGSSSQAGPLDIASLSATHRPAVKKFKMASVTDCTLQVSRGRRFVIDRLCALQRSLPPRPIGVALDLVKAIWIEYDYSTENVHWIDVMVSKGFQTLFG